MTSLDLNAKLGLVENLLGKAERASAANNKRESAELLKSALGAMAEIKGNHADLEQIGNNYDRFRDILQRIGGKIKVLDPGSFNKYQNILALLRDKRVGETEFYSGTPAENSAVTSMMLTKLHQKLAKLPKEPEEPDTASLRSICAELLDITDGLKIANTVLPSKGGSEQMDDMETSELNTVFSKLLNVTDKLLDESARLKAQARSSDQVRKKR